MKTTKNVAKVLELLNSELRHIATLPPELIGNGSGAPLGTWSDTNDLDDIWFCWDNRFSVYWTNDKKSFLGLSFALSEDFILSKLRKL